jgi:hypothetical protein
MKSRTLAAAMALVLPLPLLAQTQQVRPPIAHYWLNVETAGGMGMEIPPGMAGMMPPGMQGGKRMKLDLGSSQSPRGEPRAMHVIPPGLAMGPSLPLVTPKIERAPTREVEEEREYERPKGRMLIYWGCGEAVRAGQPVIIDFANMNSQDAARARPQSHVWHLAKRGRHAPGTRKRIAFGRSQNQRQLLAGNPVCSGRAP